MCPRALVRIAEADARGQEGRHGHELAPVLTTQTDWEISQTDWEIAQTDWKIAQTVWEIVQTDWEIAQIDLKIAQTDWEIATRSQLARQTDKNQTDKKTDK